MITNFKTDFNVVLNKPMYAKAAHGETLQFVANLFNDAVSVDLDGYNLSALYREFGNTSSYYVVPGSIETSGNTASFTWTKECDFGERAYKIYLVARKGDEVSYPARWELDLYDVPGYTSYPVVPAPPILDFDKYELLNAPWYTKEETDSRLSGKADLSAMPTKTSDLSNDSGFITSADIPPIPQGEFLPLSGGTMNSNAGAKFPTSSMNGEWLSIDGSGLSTHFQGSTYKLLGPTPEYDCAFIPKEYQGGSSYKGTVSFVDGQYPNIFFNNFSIYADNPDATEYYGDIDARHGFSINGETSYASDHIAHMGHAYQFPENPGTLAITDDIPTKTSDLSNDSGFLSGIADESITTSKIADGAVTTAKLANGAVGTSNIGALAVNTAKLANYAVTSAKIANGSVTWNKLGSDTLDLIDAKANNKTMFQWLPDDDSIPTDRSPVIFTITVEDDTQTWSLPALDENEAFGFEVWVDYPSDATGSFYVPTTAANIGAETVEKGKRNFIAFRAYNLDGTAKAHYNVYYKEAL